MIRQNIVFLTGAGISVESGLSTFRGNDGLWTKEQFQYFASADCLHYEPEKCLNFYNMRRQRLAEVEPNEAHCIIAELEKDHNVTIITQNVDNLHERAGSTNVIHLHGEMTKVCSSRNRYDEKYIREYPLTIPIKVGDDAGDGSQLRPYIVMFGEYVKGMDEAKEFVKKADIFVVVGTSLAVYPACNLINHAHREIPKFVIDPEYMPKCDALGYKHIQTEASMGMQMLKAVLKNL